MSSLHEVKGWHSRGYLPHFDADEVPQSLTIRLADSLPRERLLDWQAELASILGEKQEPDYRRRIEEYLDQGHGSAWLRRSEAAESVESCLLHFDGQRYHMHAWVVMPNHVHALFTPFPNWSVSRLMHSLKTFTARECNKLFGLSGPFWQEDYFDRYIRNLDHFEAAVTYIEAKPATAGLCKRPEDWPYSSARHR